MSGCLWIRQLSITITEFGAGNGCMLSRSPLINVVKDSMQKEPSTMLQCKNPSWSDRAGRTEKLYNSQYNQNGLMIYLLSTTDKKCLALHFGSSDWPGTAAVGCSMIDGAFVNKDELIWRIFEAHSIDVLKSVCFVSLYSYLCNLEHDWIKVSNLYIALTHLFHCESFSSECPPNGRYWDLQMAHMLELIS